MIDRLLRVHGELRYPVHIDRETTIRREDDGTLRVSCAWPITREALLAEVQRRRAQAEEQVLRWRALEEAIKQAPLLGVKAEVE